MSKKYVVAVIGATGIDAADAVPSGAERIDLDGGLVAPGFVDLQVNGGGGVLFNDAPTSDAIRTICRAHARFGTTALLATLITDTDDATESAIGAGEQAFADGLVERVVPADVLGDGHELAVSVEHAGSMCAAAGSEQLLRGPQRAARRLDPVRIDP